MMQRSASELQVAAEEKIQRAIFQNCIYVEGEVQQQCVQAAFFSLSSVVKAAVDDGMEVDFT